MNVSEVIWNSSLNPLMTHYVLRRDHVPPRADVRPGPVQHDHHWLHDDLLQDHPGRGVLAVGQPELQRRGQLH